MPFNPDWLVPEESGQAPIDRWLGTLKGLQVEGVQVVNRIRAGVLEQGTNLTAAQKQALLGWFDGWLTRLQTHAASQPGQLSD
jgi:hypothetical protein